MIYVLTFAGAAIAAVVAAVRYLRLPQEYVWWTAALMAVVVLIAGIITFINFLRAKKAAVDKANPKASQEQLDFDNRLRDVAATIKHVERHQKSTAPARPRLVSARADTPWVAVLGLQGQGKTRLLGGPHPKRLPEYDHNGPVKGADASAAPEDRPRLFSAPGQAVFVEVPHALAHREDLRKSWLAELKLLNKRSQPLHAIVLCVAADDLVTAADPIARAGEIGDLLAAEVSDLVTNLQVHVPVFLVVTRLDRLSGFGDVLAAFENLSAPLGFELPDGRSEELAVKELRSRFDALAGWLDRRALRLLSRFREPDPPRQSRIYTLVQQLAGMQEPLAAIAQRVLAARGGDPVRLRGVFLTSAMQDGEPVVDAVLENLAKRHAATSPRPRPTRRRASGSSPRSWSAPTCCGPAAWPAGPPARCSGRRSSGSPSARRSAWSACTSRSTRPAPPVATASSTSRPPTPAPRPRPSSAGAGASRSRAARSCRCASSWPAGRTRAATTATTCASGACSATRSCRRCAPSTRRRCSPA
ncbi:type VI secretion protein IcmF/TssM N-terminal domain-containing protein [Nannocystis pusilla]|uniref:type VI secretion protein IcmF/TssM N-terminal domain-containing protein n=1 Tax=Nannocystis pusilla TaxID=889268 RepID=UPI003B81A7E7